ncbi:hypothetical protein CBR_g16920 [Chara braunii]|uniref:Uncharacterized protein n=1 Tax=Chara braunii TaxID=69332 RepID=A0A388KU50_CHABU|nr:hypothetical protein CBR_g16920 [Chara braunii]|eukprot:GBG73576.1 hypothetical protein CBR_g16920 [Chara braunii]
MEEWTRSKDSETEAKLPRGERRRENRSHPYPPLNKRAFPETTGSGKVGGVEQILRRRLYQFCPSDYVYFFFFLSVVNSQSGAAASPDPAAAAAAAAAAASGGAGTFGTVAAPGSDPAMVGPGGNFAYIDRKAAQIPSKYDGKDDVEAWISSMRSYFDVLGIPLSTQSSILGTNVEPVVRGFLETQAVQSGYKRIDLNKWLKATPTTTLEDLLIKQYADPHAAAKARLKLDKLKHNKWTGTVHSLHQHVSKLFATPDVEMTVQYGPLYFERSLRARAQRIYRLAYPHAGLSQAGGTIPPGWIKWQKGHWPQTVSRQQPFCSI